MNPPSDNAILFHLLDTIPRTTSIPQIQAYFKHALHLLSTRHQGINPDRTHGIIESRRVPGYVSVLHYHTRKEWGGFTGKSGRTWEEDLFGEGKEGFERFKSEVVRELKICGAQDSDRE